MTEDFRSPFEIEDEENRKLNQSSKSSASKVDSLVDNDAGAITMGNSGKKSSPKKKTSGPFWSRGLKLWPSSRKHKIIGSSVAVGILVLGAGGVFALSNMFKTEPEPQVAVKHEPKTKEPSKLTGIEVPLKTNEQRVIGIMIENSPDARPQAGLRDAGVVFEAIAEGGITRFLALFLESDPSYIGPVRSVRPYYAEWARGFDAALAHAGGSADGLAKVRSLKVSDLDYTIAGNAFRRVSDRYAPHNLYTSIDGLRKETKRLKMARESKFTGFARKKELPINAERPPKIKKIAFSISGGLYDVRWTYDQKSNSYKRVLAGTAHRDHRSGKQISPKVVVALITSYSQNGIYSVYKTAGSGQVIVFQDGQATKGVWKRKTAKDPLQFFDGEGKPLRLNPGQTWITALRSGGEAKYGP